MRKIVICVLLFFSVAIGAAVAGQRTTPVWTPAGWQMPDKDPGSTVDYEIDLTKLLSGDTIAGSSWTADPGITLGAMNFSATTVTVWLSGGTVGMMYRVTNTVTTAGGRTIVRSFLVLVNLL